MPPEPGLLLSRTRRGLFPVMFLHICHLASGGAMGTDPIIPHSYLRHLLLSVPDVWVTSCPRVCASSCFLVRLNSLVGGRHLLSCPSLLPHLLCSPVRASISHLSTPLRGLVAAAAMTLRLERRPQSATSPAELRHVGQ